MKHTLADTAYDYLLNMIYTSELKSGDRVSEQSIIESLGISRTPVREAIRRLAADGLIDFLPGTFARVHTFSAKEQQDMGYVRIAIDSLAARLAVLNGSNRDFQELAALHQKCQEATDQNDIVTRIKYDCAFHEAITVISQNRELISVQQRLSQRSRLMQIQGYNLGGKSFCNIDGHLVIIQSLVDRDTDSCLKAIEDHLRPFYMTSAPETDTWETLTAKVHLSDYELV